MYILNGKARYNYNEIYANEKEFYQIENKLQNQFKSLHITTTPGLDSKSITPSLMVDSSGRFFVEKWENNHEYIGTNPYNPTNEEKINKLHIKNHLDAYYSLAVKHKDVLGFE